MGGKEKRRKEIFIAVWERQRFLTRRSLSEGGKRNGKREGRKGKCAARHKNKKKKPKKKKEGKLEEKEKKESRTNGLKVGACSKIPATAWHEGPGKKKKKKKPGGRGW